MLNEMSLDYAQFLLPTFPQDNEFAQCPTKSSLLEVLKEYDSEKSYPSKEEKIQKRSIAHKVNHQIYSLEMLKKVPQFNAFRFIVNTKNQILFGVEGLAGINTPAHYQLARLTLDSKDIPDGYHQSKGAWALAAGRIYRDKETQKIIEIDTNSGGFRPDVNSATRALAIMLLCAPDMFADSITFTVLDNRGGVENKHTCSKQELIELVSDKFSERDKTQMILKNQGERLITLRSETQKSARPDLWCEKSNSTPRKKRCSFVLDENVSPVHSPAKSIYSSPQSSPQLLKLRREVLSDKTNGQSGKVSRTLF